MDSLTTYLTLKKPSEGEFRDRGSKFIAQAFPVNSSEEIARQLESLRKQYHDARHHCYAWRLGPNGDMYRANDDGEPNHSAGDPILGQIRSFGLTGVLVVVIRYFGGTKLGVSGLIHAYRTATDEALKNADIIEVPVTAAYTLTYPYDSTNEIMRLLDEFSCKVVSQEYTDICQQVIEVNVSLESGLKEKVTLLEQLGHSVSLDYRG